MKTLAMASLMAIAFAANSAVAAEHPVLQVYGATAEALVKAAETAATEQELGALEQGTRDLIMQGVEIMKVYEEKNPKCHEQFAVFLQELPEMEKMSVDAIHDRYHDGKGLPVAPRHCYLGRSQVVHPVMNLVRLQGEWNENARIAVLEELDEVIEHLAKIQKNLDNPPN